MVVRFGGKGNNGGAANFERYSDLSLMKASRNTHALQTVQISAIYHEVIAGASHDPVS